MAQVLVTGLLAFLLLQLAASQSPECQNALNTLLANTASCTATVDDPLVICNGDCRQYYDAVIEICDETVSSVIVQSLLFIISYGVSFGLLYVKSSSGL